MYLVLYSEHCLQPVFVLEFFSSRCPTLFGETYGSRFKGQGREQMVRLMGYDNTKAHKLASQDSLHHTVAQKCAL